MGYAVKDAPSVTPSRFNIHVFVLSDAAAAEVLGQSEFLRLPCEWECDPPNHVCWEASTALYLRASSVSQPDVLVEAVSTAAGWNTLRNFPTGRPAGEEILPK